MTPKKVRCVNDAPGVYGPVEIVKNEIYTAIGLTDARDGYILEEVKAKKGNNGGFAKWRFIDVDMSFGESLVEEMEINIEEDEAVLL